MVAIIAGWIGSQFADSNQLLANANPPAISYVTAEIRSGTLTATVNARADVVQSGAVSIFAPSPSGQGISVITSINVSIGQKIHSGTVLLSVSLQPIIAFQGEVPAFRDLRTGDSGIDVTQLQRNLADLGFSTGSDQIGWFGNGTTSAVRSFFRARGLEQGLLGASTHSVTLALGEIVFLPRLPAVITSLNVGLGSTVGSATPILVASTGSISLRAVLDSADAASVHVGDPFIATSDINGTVIRGQVQFVSRLASSQYSVTTSGAPGFLTVMSPTSGNPNMLNGQNVGVQISTGVSTKKSWIVPLTAATTRADGLTYVTFLLAGNRTESFPVRIDLVASPFVAVSFLSAAAIPSKRVIIDNSSIP